MVAYTVLERDFMAALDADPEFRDAIRARLLTRELLELPETVRHLSDAIVSLEAALRQFMEATNRRLAALEAGETRWQQNLAADVGEIRGFHARETFIRSASILLRARMGFKLKSRLSQAEIYAILFDADTTGVDEDDLTSFINADALLLVEDADGAERYVAVEVSYTVHTDDVERADRNARLLAEWTGLPADSAVAGVHLHDAAWKMSRDTGTTYLRIQSRSLRAR